MRPRGLTASARGRALRRRGLSPSAAARRSGGPLYHPAPMRRAGPILILVIGVLALVVTSSALPMPAAAARRARASSRPSSASTCGAASGSSTRSLPTEGKTPDARRPRRHARDHRQPDRQVRRRRAPGRRPGQRPDRRRDAGRPERGPDPQPRRHDRAAWTSCRSATPRWSDQGQPRSTCDGDSRRCSPATRSPPRQIGQNETGQRTVDFTLSGEGKDLFAEYTADNIGKYFAIVLDGEVISAPVIQSSIPNGQVQIQSGGIGGYPLEPRPRTSSRSSSSASCRSRSRSSRNTTVSPTLGDAVPAAEPARRR